MHLRAHPKRPTCPPGTVLREGIEANETEWIRVADEPDEPDEPDEVDGPDEPVQPFEDDGGVSFVGITLCEAHCLEYRTPVGAERPRAAKCVRPDGTVHGTYLQHFRNGRLAIWGRYDNNKKTGWWSYSLPSGQLYDLVMYKAGKAADAAGCVRYKLYSK